MVRAASLLCLDAPLVAVAWQALFAHVFGVRLGAATRGALFLTTWAIYLFDRLADGASLTDGMPMSARQQFARRHRPAGVGLLALVAVLDLVLVAGLSPRLLVGGAIVGVLCVAYLYVNRNADRTWLWLPIKELSIGVLFALGTVAALVPVHRIGFVPSVALFGLLCATNCATVAAWERELDARQGKASLGTRWPRLGNNVPLLIGGVALAGWIMTLGLVPLAIGLPLSAAALLLGLLHMARRSIAPDDRTALADLALLAPLLPGLVVYLR
ncbi:MAG: hypothetical protein ABI321_06880 [Polyangia bacterium]